MLVIAQTQKFPLLDGFQEMRFPNLRERFCFFLGDFVFRGDWTQQTTANAIYFMELSLLLVDVVSPRKWLGWRRS
jgi:hypothetical protein